VEQPDCHGSGIFAAFMGHLAAGVVVSLHVQRIGGADHESQAAALGDPAGHEAEMLEVIFNGVGVRHQLGAAQTLAIARTQLGGGEQETLTVGCDLINGSGKIGVRLIDG